MLASAYYHVGICFVAVTCACLRKPWITDLSQLRHSVWLLTVAADDAARAAAAAAVRIMMAAISKLVAVIPVIAKADTFTAQEMEDFRQELLQVRLK